MAGSSPDVFDYIVVGAGTSGCALVGALAASLPAARIAVVESGPAVSSATIRAPGRWPANLGREHDYHYQTLPQASLKGRRVNYARGRGLGGSNLINVMMYSRGFKADWDKMPAGWQSKDVEPLFEKLEAQLHTSHVSVGAFGAAVAEAAQACNLTRRRQSPWEEHGMTTTYKATIDARTGQRLDIFQALGVARENVVVVPGIAERLLIDDQSRRVTGVRLQNQRELTVNQSGEIVLCAGAVSTPQLLQLSGVGPSELLKGHGIRVLQDLPVGDGLKDHVLLPLSCLCQGRPSAGELSPNSVQGWLHDEPSGIQIFLVDGQAAADFLPINMTMPFTGEGCMHRLLRGQGRCLGACVRGLLQCSPFLHRQTLRVAALMVALVRPESQGTVHIRSADPLEPPAIDPKFLSSEADRRNLNQGIATARALFGTSPLKEHLAADLTLGPRLDGVYQKYMAGSYYHPTGTCRIGACVDGDLRVLGLTGLRVADASVLPVHPRVGTQAACFVIGARCADLILWSAGIKALREECLRSPGSGGQPDEEGDDVCDSFF